MVEKISEETKTEQLTKEVFLDKLYDKTLDWLTSNSGELLLEFPPQAILIWDHHSDDLGPGVDLSLLLKKGAIVRDARKDFALVLGKGKRNKWDESHLRLQFGFLPRHQNRINLSVEDLPGFVSPHSFHHGRGEFYIDPRTNSVRIHCWADSRVYGGEDVGSWNQEQLLSDKGLEECLGVVKRTVRQAYDSDLT